MTYVDAYIADLSRAAWAIRIPVLKVGGQPVWFEDTTWPICETCNPAMDFLAQIPLQRPIAFSKRYAMAYVFMCPGARDERGWLTCPTWEPVGGANRVILQAASDEVRAPDARAAYPDYVVTLHQVKEPLIDTAAFRLEDDLPQAVSDSTKIGGVPAWVQSNETPRCPACGGSMRFVAQLNAELDGSLPPDPRAWDDEAYKFLNFGADGLGYLFICTGGCGPDGAAFLWQST